MFLMVLLLILGCILIGPSVDKNSSDLRAVVLSNPNIGKNTSETVVRNNAYEASSFDIPF